MGGGKSQYSSFVNTLIQREHSSKGEGRDERGRKGREVQFSVYGV